MHGLRSVSFLRFSARTPGIAIINRAVAIYDPRAMPFRPDRHANDRRRRLLTEEILSGGFDDAPDASAAPERRTARGKLPRYSKAADMSQQPRVTDLIPQRPFAITLLFLLGAAIIGGLVWLHAWMPQVAAMANISDGRVAAFDLDGEGSLGAWFSSLVLLLSGLAAVLNYTLRRHRLDDYRAGYRIWLWAAIAWFIMSIDEAGSLHEGFKELMVYWTGNRIYGDGSMWWVIAYGSVLGLLGLLLLWDMRECRVATWSFLLTGGCYAAAVATQLEFVWPTEQPRAVMLEEGLEMFGNLALLLTMVTNARFIIFDIEGRIVRKPAKPKTRKAAKVKKSSSKTTTDSPPAKTTPTPTPSARGQTGKKKAPRRKAA